MSAPKRSLSDNVYRNELRQRIEANVVLLDSGCWIWMGSTMGGGYGQISVQDRPYYVHRLSHELFVGPIPEGLEVCHRCDTRLCCTPDDLFLGTHAVNVADCVAKGRNSPPPRNDGARHWRATLSDEQVREIRVLSANGISNVEIARRFDLPRNTVRNFVTGISRRAA